MSHAKDYDDWIEGRIVWKAKHHGIPCARTYLFGELSDDVAEYLLSEMAARDVGRPVLAFVDSLSCWTLLATKKAASQHDDEICECRLDQIEEVRPRDYFPRFSSEREVLEWKRSWEYLRIMESTGVACDLWVPCGKEAFALWNILRMFPGVCHASILAKNWLKDCRIRPETVSDLTAIEAVIVAAFLEAPHTSHTEQFIVAALRAAGALSVSLVAEAEGNVVGHVAVSPVTISDGTLGWYGLGPISVLPAWQGRGVGSALMRAALEALRERGAAGGVVLGEPVYYGRFGFKAEPGLVLPDIPPEYFQAVLLCGAILPRGSVTYHQAFSAEQSSD